MTLKKLVIMQFQVFKVLSCVVIYFLTTVIFARSGGDMIVSYFVYTGGQI